MKYEQRKEVMLKLLKNSEIVNMQTLVEELNSSEATIRRDIVRMEKEGLVKRYWGGIKRTDSPNNIRTRNLNNIFDNDLLNIGRYAASQIRDGDLVYIGSGTTTLAMINYLDNNQKLTVVTNGIPQLEALYEKGIKALLLCGFYKEYSQSVVGTETSNMLEKYSFDKSFIGANGIDDQYNILSADYYEDTLKKLAIRNSKRSYCLVKDDKFDRKAYYHVDKELCDDVVFITNQPKNDLDKWNKAENVYYAKVKDLIND